MIRLAAAAAGLGLLVLLAVGLGPEIGLMRAWAVLLEAAGGGAPADAPETVVVLDLRLPRTLLAALLGGALGAAGAVAQGLFRNALAEPSVLGVSAGAAAAAVVSFSLGLDELAAWATPVCAAAGAVASLVALVALAGGTGNLTSLLLGGVALSAVWGALITLLLALQVERWELGLEVLGWLMGSFEGRSWPQLGWALGPAALGLGAAVWLRRDLDLLHLGPDTAASLGLDLARTRTVAIGCVALLVGTATALVGVIGFVGLIVPHAARMLAGPGHRATIPLAAILGAVLLVVVDASARTGAAVSVPPGVVTSLLGGPFFLWLLRHGDRAELT